MVKTVVFEGQPHYLANVVKQIGVQKFIVFAYNNRLPIAIVKNALELAGVDVAVTSKALDFYCTQLRSTLGVADVPRGIGMQETIKGLSKSRFRASFLVDSSMNLMPEMMIDKNTGLFKSINRVSAENNIDLKTLYNKFGSDIYQPICHSMTRTRAAFIIDIENELLTNPTTGAKSWGKPNIKYYKPDKIETDSAHSKTTSMGMLSTSLTCSQITYNTYAMLASNTLLSAIHIRVAATLYPNIL